MEEESTQESEEKLRKIDKTKIKRQKEIEFTQGKKEEESKKAHDLKLKNSEEGTKETNNNFYINAQTTRIFDQTSNTASTLNTSKSASVHSNFVTSSNQIQVHEENDRQIEIDSSTYVNINLNFDDSDNEIKYSIQQNEIYGEQKRIFSPSYPRIENANNDLDENNRYS